MRAKIKKWVDALRSGQYKQGQGQLSVDNKYCCLGVLCDVLGVESKLVGIGKYYYDTLDEEWVASSLPKQVQLELGITILGDFKQSDNTYRSLSHCNDVLNLNFNQIADWIEKIEKDDTWVNVRVSDKVDICILHDSVFSVVPNSDEIDYLIYVLKGTCTLTRFEQTLYDLLMSGI